MFVTMFFDDGVVPLSEIECHALLAGQTVGHLSLTIAALPVVAPVKYQYLGGDVVIGVHDGACDAPSLGERRRVGRRQHRDR